MERLSEKNQELENNHRFQPPEDDKEAIRQDLEKSLEQLKQAQRSKAGESQHSAAKNMRKMAKKMKQMRQQMEDRKRVVEGKRVDVSVKIGGRRYNQKYT